MQAKLAPPTVQVRNAALLSTEGHHVLCHRQPVTKLAYTVKMKSLEAASSAGICCTRCLHDREGAGWLPTAAAEVRAC
jgi:hypothetical protein